MISEFQKQTALLLGLTNEDLAPLSENEMKEIYRSAFEYYENAKYRKAGQLFTQLVLQDPFSEPFWTGLASSKQMSHDYDAALKAWALSSLLDDTNPLPHFHAAECYVGLEKKTEAFKALDTAYSRAGSDADLLQRIGDLKLTLAEEN